MTRFCPSETSWGIPAVIYCPYLLRSSAKSIMYRSKGLIIYMTCKGIAPEFNNTLSEMFLDWKPVDSTVCCCQSVAEQPDSEGNSGRGRWSLPGSSASSFLPSFPHENAAFLMSLFLEGELGRCAECCSKLPPPP